MELRRAFDIRSGETIALTGAGGKSGLMFALAQALEQPVVLTTTTHLGVWQAPLAERHLILNPGDDFPTHFPKDFHTLLLTGPAGEDDRLSGLADALLREIRSLCQAQGWTLLIEADGARQRPLKAPAGHEPVVPDWVDGVIVVAGMSALGQPLSAECVHRPERFGELSGLSAGDAITVETTAAVLSSPQGGLQGLPENARRWLYLNQADSAVAQAQAQRLAKVLGADYINILIGSLQEPGQAGPIFSVHSPVAGVILAAGSSQRLGRPKQLLTWEGQPFIRQVCLNALAGGLAPLTVVTGAMAERVQAAIADLPVQIVHNSNWETGQSTSMRAGLNALPPDAQGVMFLLSDQPQAGPHLIRGLVERFYSEHRPITAPRVAGRRGNPVLFGRETFDALSSITGDQGGRAVFDRFETAWLAWVDERMAQDVDGEVDYHRLMDSYSL